MKQQVELFDCAVFLDKFQELVPIDEKRVSFSLQIYILIYKVEQNCFLFIKIIMQFFKILFFVLDIKFTKKISKFYKKEIYVLQVYVNTYSLILKSKFPTHKRLSSTWFDFIGSNGKGTLVSGSILKMRWTGVKLIRLLRNLSLHQY